MPGCMFRAKHWKLKHESVGKACTMMHACTSCRARISLACIASNPSTAIQRRCRTTTRVKNTPRLKKVALVHPGKRTCVGRIFAFNVAPDTKPSEAQEGLRVPLECQQFLGLEAGQTYKDSIINQTYDDLVQLQPERGFSQAAIAARVELLEIVRRDIITSKGRGTPRKEVNIPYDLLPGALALLAELGQDELVLDIGEELLFSQRMEGFDASAKQDVFLAMALAKVNLASDTLERPGQVSAGCAHLEDALELLHSTGTPSVAPALMQEITESLADLRTQEALEQLSGPATPAYQDTRRAALRCFKEHLKQGDAALAGRGERSKPTALSGASAAAAALDPALIQKLVQQLTAEELVHLLEWEPIARNPLQHKWVYPGLLETVAIGHIVHGFCQCQPAYIKMAAGILKHLPQVPDVLVAQAVCQVLLGSVQASTALLNNAQKLGGSRAGAHATSGKWNEQPYQFVVDMSPAGDDGLLPGLCLFTEQWLGKVALPLFRDTAGAPPPQGALVKYFDDARVETLITVYDERGNGLADSLSTALDQAKRALLDNAAKAPVSTPNFSELHAVSTPNFSELQALAAEKGIQPGRNMLAVAAAALATGVIGLLALSGRKPAAVQPAPSSTVTVAGSHAAPAATAAAAASEAGSVQADRLDSVVAEKLIKTWQDVKQSCMGPAHDCSLLPSVLSEPVLSETRSKAASFQKQGWFVRYKLWKCKVTAVDSSTQPEGFSTVVASIDESATMYGMDGRQADSYRSTYDAKYEVVQMRDGSWHIAKLTVLGQEPSTRL